MNSVSPTGSWALILHLQIQHHSLILAVAQKTCTTEHTMSYGYSFSTPASLWPGTSLSSRRDRGHLLWKIIAYLMKLSYINHPLQILICILDYHTMCSCIFFFFFLSPSGVTFWVRSLAMYELFVYLLLLLLFHIHLAVSFAKYSSSLSGASQRSESSTTTPAG